ncbi:hypothetical protein [Arthrobacter sp. Br18]|uniref:hypothetical protein n=1 Tax=Arthrobacter sp. Br18 TaxID=1312954 RepID=UPI000686FA4F|nr:hypothetical protein [Arthrobacter sp. Br18]
MAVTQQSGKSDQLVSWPDLPIGLVNPHVTVVSAFDGAWVLYSPMRENADQLPQNGATALHISPEGDLTPFFDLVHVTHLGTTRHGLWLSVRQWDANVDVEADWLVDRTLLILSADGGTHHMIIDRMPAAAFEKDRGAHLVVYTSAPNALRDGHGGASYTYRFSQIDLPSGDLPSRLCFTEHERIPVEEDQIPGRSRHEEARVNPITPDGPRVSWTLVNLPFDQKKAAVDAIRAEFAHLDAYWTAPSGAKTPLSDGLSSTRLDVVDDWPNTRVEVSFAHPHYPEGRLRRTYRVFDSAGRIRPTDFAAIHLMEDLDTRDLPLITNAHNNILDI